MRFALVLFSFLALVSCKKQEDSLANSYAGQEAPYCNDPVAINYNHEFPGTADNTTCIYPTDPFVGTYHLQDTVFTADYASFYVITDTITIHRLSQTRMAVTGFCGPADSLKLTAGRYYRASVDTTVVTGQPLCNLKDTINGTFAKDAVGVRINFILMSDTAGTKFHRGVATLIQ